MGMVNIPPRPTTAWNQNMADVPHRAVAKLRAGAIAWRKTSADGNPHDSAVSLQDIEIVVVQVQTSVCLHGVCVSILRVHASRLLSVVHAWVYGVRPDIAARACRAFARPSLCLRPDSSTPLCKRQSRTYRDQWV